MHLRNTEIRLDIYCVQCKVANFTLIIKRRVIFDNFLKYLISVEKLMNLKHNIHSNYRLLQ